MLRANAVNVGNQLLLFLISQGLKEGFVVQNVSVRG